VCWLVVPGQFLPENLLQVPDLPGIHHTKEKVPFYKSVLVYSASSCTLVSPVRFHTRIVSSSTVPKRRFPFTRVCWFTVQVSVPEYLPKGSTPAIYPLVPGLPTPGQTFRPDQPKNSAAGEKIRPPTKSSHKC
jgi:hypothetical protein